MVSRPDVNTPAREKYRLFQELLSHNNSALALMADLESKLSGDALLEKKEIQRTISRILGEVQMTVRILNGISNNGYLHLHDRFSDIAQEIDRALTARMEIPVCSYTVPFHHITGKNVYEVGNKIAHLGDLGNYLHIPVPEGFAVSTFAFKKFLEYAEVFDEAQKLILLLRAGDIDSMQNAIEELRTRIVRADIPPDIGRDICDAYRELCEKKKRHVRAAIRSSAVLEDGESSFAGQYATFLNVPGDLIVQKYKEVIASLYSPGALYYYHVRGYHESEIAMAVGILEMIDAQVAGVLYTRDPNTFDDSLVISAVFGIGRSAVDGVTGTITYRVARHPFSVIMADETPSQTDMFVCRADGGIEKVPVSESIRGRACLTAEHLETLTGYALAIEEHYGYPQDIEWAVDESGNVIILQTRHLFIPSMTDASCQCAPVQGYKVILNRGSTASKGVGYGNAVIMNTMDNMNTFPDKGVLVTHYSSTRFVPVLGRASALITDIGSPMMHLATIAREFGVPALVGTQVATRVLKNGQAVTVDATNCIVYEGHVKELFRESKAKKQWIPESHFMALAKKVIALIIPLTLVDIYDEKFKPEFCLTLHDVIRFAHQKAMQEMFNITAERPGDSEVHRLSAGIPVCVDVIDIGGGAATHSQRNLSREEIYSFPLNALMKGLTAMPWPEPRHIGVSGFLGLVAHTASMPEEELEQMGERSYAFISEDYMNFSIRLGYHLSVIEAFAGENMNDNYIRFFFQGGGADRTRRARRVMLLEKILQKLGFFTKTSEDVLDALVTKDTRENLGEKLYVLGKLTVFTKQIDAIMHDDAAIDKYSEEFLREYFPAHGALPSGAGATDGCTDLRAREVDIS